jgi:hypothetical protein
MSMLTRSFEDRDVSIVKWIDGQGEKAIWMELDINADTCCVGGNVMIVNKTDCYISDNPFICCLGTAK